ncbi:hypothetical protein B6D19_02445 [Gilliamella apicola]|uniref:DUF3999 family protein n=1 Tax=Gilliamella apicola TaxID=1196095 RepID=UPI000A3488AB|nr:DUF3999 family protein [Gilliamella apicola]OTQ33691.1 hypothetical protein B6D19_02445 [Gilliamella apicola]OTQ38273.1 hypothetical protein B6D20_11860 [Gilliamella apicola]
MKKILFSSLLLISGLCQATDQTNQYAYGAMIEISDNTSMYNRIDLTSEVYTQALSNTLDDVRVFNHKGQLVPFALVNVYQQYDKNDTFPVTVYTLDNTQQSHKNDDNDTKKEEQNKLSIEQYSININNKNVQIYLDNPNKQEGYNATYLLQIPNEIKLEQPFSRLSIDFDTSQNLNWQATAKLLYSNDLKKWQTAINDIPIMSLIDNNNNQSLNVNTIDLPSGINFKSNYWILQLKSDKQLVPSIKGVEFTSRKEMPTKALYPINFDLISFNEQEAIYQLPTSLPIKELSIKLQNDRTVLPASIYYKISDNDKTWHKLDDYIFRRINDDQGQSIKINNSVLNIKQLKIKAINASLNDAPFVTAYRYRMSIIFNSANNGPFILAWGSANAKPASLSEKALLADSISSQNVPEAYLGDNVKLGNKKVLSETDNISTKSPILPKLLIWGILIAGSIFLMFLALKLLKEMKKVE